MIYHIYIFESKPSPLNQWKGMKRISMAQDDRQEKDLFSHQSILPLHQFDATGMSNEQIVAYAHGWVNAAEHFRPTLFSKCENRLPLMAVSQEVKP